MAWKTLLGELLKSKRIDHNRCLLNKVFGITRCLCQHTAYRYLQPPYSSHLHTHTHTHTHTKQTSVWFQGNWKNIVTMATTVPDRLSQFRYLIDKLEELVQPNYLERSSLSSMWSTLANFFTYFIKEVITKMGRHSHYGDPSLPISLSPFPSSFSSPHIDKPGQWRYYSGPRLYGGQAHSAVPISADSHVCYQGELDSHMTIDHTPLLHVLIAAAYVRNGLVICDHMPGYGLDHSP